MALRNRASDTITAFGGRAYITPLSHYGALQLTRDVTWSNERILAEGHRFTDWPGWTRRTGNEALGISVNQKAAGRSVTTVVAREAAKAVFGKGKAATIGASVGGAVLRGVLGSLLK